jgi:hypothetical protein
MGRRDFVTFTADFPDDAQWDERGDLLVPGGRAIAEALRENFQGRGLRCSEVCRHSSYGWAFDATSEKNKVWTLLAAAAEGWLLQLVQRKSLLAQLIDLTSRNEFPGLQREVHATLTSDKRFSNVLWYTRADYEGRQEGSRTPFS